MNKTFTGFKDMHGNKIYVGDKLKYSYYICGGLSYEHVFEVS